MLQDLFQILSKLKLISSNDSESWYDITFKGDLEKKEDIFIFGELYSEIKSSTINKTISFQIDTSIYSTFTEFSEDLFVGSSWKVTVNKVANIEDTKLNFFLDIKELKKWAQQINPFYSENPFNKHGNLIIIVNQLKQKLIGSNYKILNQFETVPEIRATDHLPVYDDIIKYVHVLAQEDFQISPKNFLIIEGECDDNFLPFFEMCSMTLAAALSSELINNNLIVLRGIRKIELSLYKNTTRLGTKFIHELKNTVEWIYEERTDLRLKLFLDRVTLDIDYNNDYVHELALINVTSLIQAKERFAFAIFERKDQYHKELRELLKDLKTISDLYSNKVRSVLSNLLRDVLAGFLLIGITLLSKVENIENVVLNPTLQYVFQAFSIYFLISICYQTVFDLVDIKNTTKEFSYWKRTSREYISEKEFEAHLKETIDKRKSSTYIFYGVLCATYVVLAYCCWNFTNFINQLTPAA